MNNSNEIAIIGFAGRYAQADNIDDLWKNLKNGKDCITEVPSDRFDIYALYDKEKGKMGTTYTKWGGFLSSVKEFDARFFSINPLQAPIMDPQERLLLETSYHAFEHAGLIPSELEGGVGDAADVGVYVGSMWQEYPLYASQLMAAGKPIILTGNPSSLANRISYSFNFSGPSLTIDTMCSSSLTALHYAVQDLQNGVCSHAVVSGVNVSIHPLKYLMMGQFKSASSKGRCEAFGDSGDGFVASEGVGSLILKPLAQAEIDGDRIFAVVKGSALGHGGNLSSKSKGYAVPNYLAQSDVIQKALKNAGVKANEVSYIESHGTGTAKGDPIEMDGLIDAFKGIDEKIHIGSVKSNIGHSEGAAGVASIVKVLLQMQHDTLVPSLHCEPINHRIDWDHIPFSVQKVNKRWSDISKGRKIAGISAFGAGGSNAHVILAEYQTAAATKKPERKEVDKPYIMGLSVKMNGLGSERQQLKELAQAYLRLLDEQGEDINLSQLEYASFLKRDHFESRLAIIFNNVIDLKHSLECIKQAATFDNMEAENIFHGTLNKTSRLINNEIGNHLGSLVHKQDLVKLAKLWVNGIHIEWREIFADRIQIDFSLPLYPFYKESFWFDDLEKYFPVASNDYLHDYPLLEVNRSTLDEHSYTLTLTANTEFIAGHQLNGCALVPGAAYISFARQALSAAINDSSAIFLIRQIKFVAPFLIENKDTLCIDIQMQDGYLAFDIYCSSRGEKQLMCQGESVFYDEDEIIAPELSDYMGQHIKELQHNDFYNAFSRINHIRYSSHFTIIDQVRINEDAVITTIDSPILIDNKYSEIYILDAVLQSSFGLTLLNDKEQDLAMLPYSIDQVVYISELKGPLTVLCLPNDDEKIDFYIFNEQLNVVMIVLGFFGKKIAIEPHQVDLIHTVTAQLQIDYSVDLDTLPVGDINFSYPQFVDLIETINAVHTRNISPEEFLYHELLTECHTIGDLCEKLAA